MIFQTMIYLFVQLARRTGDVKMMGTVCSNDNGQLLAGDLYSPTFFGGTFSVIDPLIVRTLTKKNHFRFLGDYKKKSQGDGSHN